MIGFAVPQLLHDGVDHRLPCNSTAGSPGNLWLVGDFFSRCRKADFAMTFAMMPSVESAAFSNSEFTHDVSSRLSERRGDELFSEIGEELATI